MHLSDEVRRALMVARWLVLGLVWVLTPAGAADIEFVTQELPWAVLNRPYSPAPLEARSSGTCPLGGISYAVVSGELPLGVQMSRLGYLSGVPTEMGRFEIAVRVSNGCTWTARHFVFVVTEPAILAASVVALEFPGHGAAAQTIKLVSTWPRLTYQAATNVPWLTLVPSKGFFPDEVTASVNTKNLKPGRYEGEITISAWQAVDALRLPVVLVVGE